jgi:hypothetical protein
LALSVAAGGPAQPPTPQPAPSPPGQPAPWANKFFLPDIATNREQTPPPVIVHNFGDVPHGTLCVHTFTITNVYESPMQITEVRKSCQCLDFVPMTRVLQPNETAEFTVTMHSGKFVGNNAQKFYVSFGPKFISTAVIELRANSRTDVTVNPGAVSFGTIAAGTKAAPQSVVVKYSGRNRDWKLTEVVPPQGPLEVQLTETNRGGPIRGGAEYQVTVTLKPTAPAGAITEQVSIKTNDPTNPLVQITVTGMIAAPLEVSPNKVRFDDVPVGKVGTQRVLIRAAKPFQVLGVDGAGEGITVELPPAAALPVQVLTVKFESTKPGAVARELRIRTDLDGNGVALLPVEATGTK